MKHSPTNAAQRFTRFCGAAAIILLLALLTPLAVSALGLTVFESIYGT